MDAYINSIIFLIVFWIVTRVLPIQKKDYIFCVISGLYFSLFSGLRDWQTCGVDLHRYNGSYEFLKNSSIEQVFNIRDGDNIAYFFLCRFCATIDLEFQTFVLLISVIFVGTFTILTYKFTKHHLLSFLLFLGLGCFTFSFSGLKQTIAMTIVMWSFILYKDNLLKSLLLVLVAMSFHSTAIVMIPIYIFSRLKITKYTVSLMIVGLLTIFVYRMQIGFYLTLLYNIDYVDAYESKGTVSGTALMLILFTVHYLFFKSKLTRQTEDEYSMVVILVIFSIGIQLCASYAYTFTRINLYNMLFLPIVISEALESRKWKHLLKGLRFHTLLYYIVIMYFMIVLYLNHVVGESLDNYKMCIL